MIILTAIMVTLLAMVPFLVVTYLIKDKPYSVEDTYFKYLNSRIKRD